MKRNVKEVETALLWSLLSDISTILSLKKYVPDVKNPLYMFWFEEYQTIVQELDYRLIKEYDEEPDNDQLPF